MRDSSAMAESESNEQKTTDLPGPLTGLKVLELGEMVAAPYCSKLLGDLGADVIKVERPDRGDPSRWRGPFPKDVPDPERSGLFLYLNTSKRSLRLDLNSSTDRETFRSLASQVDILIEDRPVGELEALNLGHSTLRARNPGLIVMSITPWGQTGPNRKHRSHHLNLYHSAGHSSPFVSLSAADGRAPARAGGYLGEYDAGLTAAVGLLAAVIGRETTGRGQHVSVSKQEAMMCLERVTIGRFANEPDPFQKGPPSGPRRTRDGWIIMTAIEDHQWDGLIRAMGSPDWAEAEWCSTREGRMEHQAEIDAHLDKWAAGYTSNELYHLVQGEGTPAAPVRNVSEVLEWEQARSRGFFQTLVFPTAGPLSVPTAPYLFSRSSWVGTPAPLLGEHDEEILKELDARPQQEARARPALSNDLDGETTKGPLSGVRVADFTWAWAGPHGSLLLGMLGAEIIKVESHARLDHSRVISLTAGGVAGGIDESPIFNDLNLGKRSVTLNLRKQEGREIARKLAAQCDVVLQNMRPGVLERLGLGYEDLSKTNPSLIMLSSSAVGAAGPERSYAGYAPTFACLSGIASISGYPDAPPLALSGSVDLRAGTASAFAILAALIHRRNRDEGQNIDLSSTEVMSSMMGEAFVGYGLTKRVPQRIGNQDEKMAPHGCYRSSAEGKWISIAMENDEEWRAFQSLSGDPELRASAFATAESRFQNQSTLDPLIERWTQSRSAEAAVTELQGLGIAAAHVRSGQDLSHDPHLAERKVFQTIEHPKLGALKVIRPPWNLEGARLRDPSPLLGQHNDYVLGSILGLDEQEIARLVEKKTVY